MSAKLKSRKFWMAVVGGIIIVANDGLGLGLPAEAITALATVIIGYIVGQGVAEINQPK